MISPVHTISPHPRNAAKRTPRAILRALAPVFGALALNAALLLAPTALRGQDIPRLVIDEDCQAFRVSESNDIAYTVPRIKRIKRLLLERDDIWIVTASGKRRLIVEADKFMPIPPVAGYTVNSLAWSSDSRRIAAGLTLQQPPRGFQYESPKEKKKKGKNKSDSQELNREDQKPIESIGGGNVVALFDSDGREISIPGLKTRFLENATRPAWLEDGRTLVYLTSGPPYQIGRVRLEDGTVSTLFAGHSFDAVVWDTLRNSAYAVGENLSVYNGLALVKLDLLRETVTMIARVESYRGALRLSPSGGKIGFFSDGDTIEVIPLAHPSEATRVHAGLGIFEWARDERRVLLKRGPADQSGDLVWVGLEDDTFEPALHDLEFHAFEIAPDGYSIAVTEPGKRILKVFDLK